MKHICKRLLALALAICLIAGCLPGYLAIEADALSVSSLTCANFISNITARNYIDTMMKYYINNSSTLQSTLNSGNSVVFMFEGGSDNYWNGNVYQNSAYDERTQAVCIVVKLNSSGSCYIDFYSENCSSIPGDPSWCTDGVAYSGSTTIMDGIYRFYKWNHTGPYAAYQLDIGTGYYTPPVQPQRL